MDEVTLHDSQFTTAVASFLNEDKRVIRIKHESCGIKTSVFLTPSDIKLLVEMLIKGGQLSAYEIENFYATLAGVNSPGEQQQTTQNNETEHC